MPGNPDVHQHCGNCFFEKNDRKRDDEPPCDECNIAGPIPFPNYKPMEVDGVPESH